MQNEMRQCNARLCSWRWVAVTAVPICLQKCVRAKCRNQQPVMGIAAYASLVHHAVLFSVVCGRCWHAQHGAAQVMGQGHAS